MESSNQRPFTELQRGCEWTGELGELDLNSKLDKQLVDCAFAAVACTSCEYFQHRHVHECIKVLPPAS